MENKIPEGVIKEAKDFVNLYGNTLKHIGKYNGYDVYRFGFPENTETGFPFLYLHNLSRDEVTRISGFDALDIINSIQKEK